MFTYEGKPAVLKQKPYLLGMQVGETLRDYKPEYARTADNYRPLSTVIDSLKQNGKPATVRVYFGSWCPACTRLVPRMLKLEEQLDGSKRSFEYYGLPKPLTDDPEAARMKVRGVPTAVVLAGDDELGRLSGNDWNQVERSLQKILSGS